MHKLTRNPGAEGAAQAAISAEMTECLADIERLADADEIPCDERAFRLAQLADCARGEYLPEVAFDPLARRLRAIAARLVGAPNVAQAWHARVRRATAGVRWEGALTWAA